MQTLLVLSLVVSCWLQSVQAVSPCDDCPVRNGLCVRGHQSECCKYINCERNLAGKTFIEHVMKCPPSLFWDNTAMRCNYPTALDPRCGNDLCASKVDSSRVEDQCYCYGYYTCYNGVSTSRSSCLQSQRFNSSTGDCVTDSTCQGGTPIAIAGPCVGVPDGNKIPDVHTCHGYYICAQGVKSYWYSCDVDQKFNPATGNCEDDTSCVHPKAPSHGCTPLTDLNFSSDHWSFENVGLQTVDGRTVGYFDGTNSFLSLSTYNNMGDKAVFIVSIIFQEKSTDADSHVLFSNCHCSGSDDCSIRSSFKKVNGDDIVVKAEVDTTNTTSRQGIDVKLPNSSGEWKLHTYIFDDGVLTNGVDATSAHNNFGGRIENRHTALHIGKHGCSSTMKPFHGYIDQLTIWTCLPDNL